MDLELKAKLPIKFDDPKEKDKFWIDLVPKVKLSNFRIMLIMVVVS